MSLNKNNEDEKTETDDQIQQNAASQQQNCVISDVIAISALYAWIVFYKIKHPPYNYIVWNLAL